MFVETGNYGFGKIIENYCMNALFWPHMLNLHKWKDWKDDHRLNRINEGRIGDIGQGRKYLSVIVDIMIRHCAIVG